MEKLQMHLLATLIYLLSLLRGYTAFQDDHLGFDPEYNSDKSAETQNVIFSRVASLPEYRSNSSSPSVGMEQVYWLTNTFLDLILRDNVLPPTINTSMIITAVESGPEDSINLIKDHWQDLLLQYIGLLTAVIVGVLLALCLPFIGFIVCCCRCAGKCGAYPDPYYDKKSDSCKRFCSGVVLSVLVIAVTFGCACAFLTNQYKYNGMTQMPDKLTNSLQDVDKYLKHTQDSTKLLLVDNFSKLEQLVVRRLEEGGVTIKAGLANRTGAGAVAALHQLVTNLGKVKRNLKDIVDDTNELDVKIAQLKEGLARSQETLGAVMAECGDTRQCREFLAKFNIETDLLLTDQYQSVQFRLPGISEALSDINDLLENRLEERISAGKSSFDAVEDNIGEALAEVKPLVKTQLGRFGGDLKSYNSKFQSGISNLYLPTTEPIPEITNDIFQYIYYAGLGMSGAVLLILMFYILGLFYGMCGSTPSEVYTGDCCDRSTGANMLASAAYLTFLLAAPLLLLTTAHFIIGSGLDTIVCDSLKHPESSDVFREVDLHFIQPRLSALFASEDRHLQHRGVTTLEVLRSCHNNHTLYNIARLSSVYDVNNLRDWRQQYDLAGVEAELRIRPVRGVNLVSRDTATDLQLLARSPLTRLELSRFKSMSAEAVIRVDMRKVVRQLRVLREEVTRGVATKLNNEILYLENMMRVAEQVKLTVRHLKQTTALLEENLVAGASVTRLVEEANTATSLLNSQGAELVRQLTSEHVEASLGLVDRFVETVVTGLQRDVGHCEPLSNSYNATVVALCTEMVQPFNGFWASIGWCFVLYLPCLLLSLSLTSLYRKTEKYPGPSLDVETQPLDSSKRRDPRRGHRRSHSRAENFSRSERTERTSSRALPPLPGEERPHSRYRNSRAEQPPRYSSNPSLNMSAASAPPQTRDRERPPPYSPQR